MFNQQHRGDCLVFSLKDHGARFKLGRFFRLVEFASKDGTDEVIIHPALLVLLNKTRAYFESPVTVTSGYRTPSHNEFVGGARNSRHVWGMASDIVVWDVSPADVQQYMRNQEVGGLGVYPTFTHVDVDGLNRRW